MYAIRVSRTDLAQKLFGLHDDICYFGMTNSKGGLRARLGQFDRTLRNRRPEHGGADRFRYDHRYYAKVLPNLYVAVSPVKADVDEPTASDLRAMGLVACLEYEFLARYLARFGELPKFNRRSSPKYSSIGR